LGFMQPPEQIGGNDGLSRAGGHGQQHMGGLSLLSASDDLFKGRPNGRILVVARLGIGGAVGHKKHGRLGRVKIDAGIPGMAGGQIRMAEKIMERKRTAL